MKSAQGWIILAGSLLGICSLIFFLFFYPYHLFFKEQMQLFLFTPDYILSYFQKPASVASLSGDFFSQFFYFIGGGPVVLALFFLLEWWLILIALKKITHDYHPVAAMFPVVAEWVLLTNLFYFLSFSMANLIGILFFLFYTSFRLKRNRLIAVLFLIPLTYFFAGSGLWIFMLLVISYELYKKEFPIIFPFLFLVLAAALPFVCRGYYLLTLHQAFLYPVCQWIGLLPLGCIIFVMIGLTFIGKKNNIVGVYTPLLLPIVLLVFLITGIYKNANFVREKILALDNESYFRKWHKVMELGEKAGMSNYNATYHINLALSQQGEMGERLMEFYQPGDRGLFLPVGQSSPILDIYFSGEVFFHLGDMNMAQHSAMLSMIFSPNNRSSRLTKRLAEINLIHADTAATEKYLRMLDATLFYRKWASYYREMLYTELPDTWLDYKRSQLPDRDLIRKAHDYPVILNLLLESNPENQPALDYLLSYYLLHKDLGSFIEVFDRYYKDTGKHIPTVYMQGLLICLINRQASPDELKSYQIQERVLREFTEYTLIYEENDGNGEPLTERFRDTYWYYFHFAKIVNR